MPWKNAENPEGLKVTGSRNVYDVFFNLWDQSQIGYRESFKLLLLNHGLIVLGVVNISEGGLTGTVADVRMMMQAAILANASCIALAHNHPSGTAKPSEADIKLTNKVKQAASLFEISLRDHIILTPMGNYYSFADEGVI